MKTLFAIGGAANAEDPVLFREFIRRAGGEAARLVIFPQASILADTGEYYRKIFKDLGVHRDPVVLEFRARPEADLPLHLEAVRAATGIFFAGGTQMRLAALFGGTALEAELLAAYQRGAVVGGTSAGAAILSRVMLAYGKGGATPRERMAQFSPGLGFADRIIFDQHFRQRDRLGRLAYAVAMHPGYLGVGVDENTAAIIEDGTHLTVVGRHAVTIVDGRSVTASNVAEVAGSRPVAISGLTVHVLTAGCTYNLRDREAHIPRPALEG